MLGEIGKDRGVNDQQHPVDPRPETQQAAPAEWGWVKPPQPLVTVETEPLAYHRLLRGIAKPSWWKPIVLLLLATAYFFTLSFAIGLIMSPIMLAFDPQFATELLEGSTEILDTQRPISIVFAMLSIIMMLPAVLLAMLTLGMRPVGRIWSVAGRIRWGILWRTLGVAVLSVIVMNVAGIGFEMLTNPAGSEAPPANETASFDVNAALLSALFILLLVPIQATAEEVVFRGLFMQVLGTWLKSPWFAILIPSVAFAFGHIYDVWGLLAVGFMGLVAAWLTWRTGGLEAAIAIHVVNNLFAFGVMTSGVSSQTAQTESAGGAGTLVGEIVGLALFAWLTLKIWRRGGHGRERIDLLVVPADSKLARGRTVVSTQEPQLAPAAEAPAAPASQETEGDQRG